LADYDYQADENYVYDDDGNRINNGYTVGPNNQMTSDGTYTYLYDEQGNRTAKFIDNDLDGQLGTGDTDITEYTWDHRNRLIRVTHRPQYGSAADKIVEYAYDFGNRWVRKLLDTGGDGTAEESRIFVYDGNQIVLDFSGPAGSELTAAELNKRYLWGPAVDQILAEEQLSTLNPELSTLYWPLTDHLNTVRDLAS